MRISTMHDVPGSTVASVLGDVAGPTARSRHIGSPFGTTVVVLGPAG